MNKISDRGRITGVLPLIQQMNPEIVILDDGMQNPVLQKNLQILTIDSL
ncbi:MAG: tetraacyldisaccharide 4'-kinase, partial [Phycisphaerae bacterium]